METETQGGRFGVMQILILLAMPLFGVFGFQFGERFGWWQAILGGLAGVVLAVPIVGILCLTLALVASAGERVFTRRP